MLNGIEVLNESYIPNGFNTFLTTIVIFCLIVGAITLAIGITDGKIIISIIGGILLVILFSIVGYSTQPSDIKQYQVTISDNVSMVEFSERYEVINVEGKIWTIVEKEEE